MPADPCNITKIKNIMHNIFKIMTLCSLHDEGYASCALNLISTFLLQQHCSPSNIWWLLFCWKHLPHHIISRRGEFFVLSMEVYQGIIRNA